MCAVIPYRLASVAFWRCYWITARPYLFFVSGVSGLAGLAVAPAIDWSRFQAAFLASFLSYGVGQALTDVFQVDTDSLSSPYRPLTQGKIRRGDVLGVSLLGLGLCALVFALLNPLNLLWGLLAVAGLLAYTPFKRRYWAGPLWNSWIVGLLPLMAFLCLTPSSAPWPTELALAIVSVGCSYAIFVLLGYLKDVSADRASGYQTLPVRFGWRATVAVSLLFGVVALVTSALLLRGAGLFARPLSLPDALALLFWLFGGLLLLLAHGRAWRERDERHAHRAIALVLRGYLLLHLGEAIAFLPVLAGPAVAFYLLFELGLKRRPERMQL